MYFTAKGGDKIIVYQVYTVTPHKTALHLNSTLILFLTKVGNF